MTNSFPSLGAGSKMGMFIQSGSEPSTQGSGIEPAGADVCVIKTRFPRTQHRSRLLTAGDTLTYSTECAYSFPAP